MPAHKQTGVIFFIFLSYALFLDNKYFLFNLKILKLNYGNRKDKNYSLTH